MEIKTKINKWDLMKLKSVCTTKETISKVKRQPSEWEKTIPNETTDKDLSPKYTSNSCSSILEKQPNQRVGQRTKQTFLQRRRKDG